MNYHAIEAVSSLLRPTENKKHTRIVSDFKKAKCEKVRNENECLASDPAMDQASSVQELHCQRRQSNRHDRGQGYQRRPSWMRTSKTQLAIF
ncbi:hypothetical protein CHS0354_033518 [Potamilus streckersoni]|uniref:Uncharacterized protein n=1 Tax=Potamilus streckersoni TaxID=2493646 RepID=A0AAE0S809_9BIVA|nr:hypothetical protein CHS0354_033518 [Potamilus streckersoni]